MENIKYILEVNGASKRYGKNVALDNLNLKVREGSVLGLLGPNGTGKTTLLKSIIGLVKLDSGNVLIDGMKPGVETKKIISYLPDSNYLFENLKVSECVDLFKDFYEDFNMEKCDNLFKRMNIDKNVRVNQMSKGYVERLNVALVMSRDAKLFVLDEPIGGVDPLAREMIIDAIIDNIGDATMIVTTHLIDSMSKLFDDVCYIDDGKVVLEGSSDELIEQKGKMLEDIYKEIYS
ncbi:MAG: ABC transporter ATP-binding protein [Tissierellia bacterium]|nr:ABC transporter ATP-binding protein [Tissierellia bacterium]